MSDKELAALTPDDAIARGHRHWAGG